MRPFLAEQLKYKFTSDQTMANLLVLFDYISVDHKEELFMNIRSEVKESDAILLVIQEHLVLKEFGIDFLNIHII